MAEHRIADERRAAAQEITLVRWLLEHGTPPAAVHLSNLDDLRVVSRCACGCASVDFVHVPGAGLEILSDYRWQDEHGHLFGVFLFAKSGRLAGLELYSIDGLATPTSLPDTGVLEPAGSGPAD